MHRRTSLQFGFRSTPGISALSVYQHYRRVYHPKDHTCASTLPCLDPDLLLDNGGRYQDEISKQKSDLLKWETRKKTYDSLGTSKSNRVLKHDLEIALEDPNRHILQIKNTDLLTYYLGADVNRKNVITLEQSPKKYVNKMRHHCNAMFGGLQRKGILSEVTNDFDLALTVKYNICQDHGKAFYDKYAELSNSLRDYLKTRIYMVYDRGKQVQD